MAQTQLGAAPRNAQVEVVLGQLCSATSEMHEALQELEQRLSSVSLNMDMTNGSGGADLGVAQSPLAQEIAVRVTSVYAARDRIRDMIHRLDI